MGAKVPEGCELIFPLEGRVSTGPIGPDWARPVASSLSFSMGCSDAIGFAAEAASCDGGWSKPSCCFNVVSRSGCGAWLGSCGVPNAFRDSDKFLDTSAEHLPGEIGLCCSFTKGLAVERKALVESSRTRESSEETRGVMEANVSEVFEPDFPLDGRDSTNSVGPDLARPGSSNLTWGMKCSSVLGSVPEGASCGGEGRWSCFSISDSRLSSGGDRVSAS